MEWTTIPQGTAVCVSAIIEDENKRNVATVEGIYAAEACWCVTRTAPR